jgi:plasmid maintenance system antidote protein VapI
MSFSGVKFKSLNDMIEKTNADPALFLVTKIQEKRWNQRKTAKVLGVSESEISKFVTGKKSLSLNQALVLSAIFDCDLKYLIKIKPEQKKKIAAALKRAEKLAA